MEFVKMHEGDFFLELFGEKKFDSHQAIFFPPMDWAKIYKFPPIF
jgi:hypothetical protein